MRKYKNLFIIGFFIFLHIIVYMLGIRAIPGKPSYKSYANDFAEVIAEDVEDFISVTSKTLDDEIGAQVVVVTVKTLNEDNIEDYSLKLARSWGVGNKGSKGLIILLALKERKMRVEIGDGIEGVINDAKAGRFVDQYAIPFLKQNDFNNGIKNLYVSIINEICSGYNIDKESVFNGQEILKYHVRTNQSSNRQSGFVIIVIVLLLLFLFRRRLFLLRTFACCNDSGSNFTGGDFSGGFFEGGPGSGSSGGSFGGGNFSGGGVSRDF